MQFRIADTLTESLGRLTGDEQKAVKTTAFDLQVNPESPGLSFHRLNKSKDRNFFSVRVNDDLRVIVHRSEGALLLCYVAHHNAAYAWAERRVLEAHPKTGAAQLVEVRETVREIEVPTYVPAEAPAAPETPTTSTSSRPTSLPLFGGLTDDELLEYGIPAEWLLDVRAATEDTLFELTDHLPSEAGEALLELATGGRPQKPVQAAPDADPFAHPDAQRRFRLMADSEELAQALEYPWEKWTVFLHPAQRDLVGRSYSGPARVAGSAGTGKTVVALHRAAHVALANPDARVLLTTFNDVLARALALKLERLLPDASIRNRIVVTAIDEVGRRLYEDAFGPPDLVNDETIRQLLRDASEAGEQHRFTLRFLEMEWRDVVDSWQLDSWEAYRDVTRLGRKTRLGEQQRRVLWAIFERVRAELERRGLVTIPGLFARVTERVTTSGARPYYFAVVDEAQDIGVPELRFLAALAGNEANGLFFAGDLGQRIFQTPFSWRSLGVDVRGRSHTLRVNYRTSHQIRCQADRLLGPEVSDVDGIVETRTGTVSAFNGPEPVVRLADSREREVTLVATWLQERVREGLEPHEIAVFVRSDAQLDRAGDAVQSAGLTSVVLDGRLDHAQGCVAVSTMHLAKGLEFRAVAVAACDDDVVPLQERIESVSDDADLEDVYETERHLLYVACTRARDHLLVTGVEPASEFLDDLLPTAAATRERAR